MLSKSGRVVPSAGNQKNRHDGMTVAPQAASRIAGKWYLHRAQPGRLRFQINRVPHTINVVCYKCLIDLKYLHNNPS